jgi:hypothetical protein
MRLPLLVFFKMNGYDTVSIVHVSFRRVGTHS